MPPRRCTSQCSMCFAAQSGTGLEARGDGRRLAGGCGGRALPIPVTFCDGCLALPMFGALPGRWLTRLPFSFRAEGGRLLCAEPLLGRGVGVLGRPFAPGRGVGVLRVGLRAAGDTPGASLT